MNEKFSRVPVEEDTKILRREITCVGDHEVLYERWSWDGVKGETFVFVADEVASLTDGELEHMVRESPRVESGSQITIKRSESGYAFVNFNFRA